MKKLFAFLTILTLTISVNLSAQNLDKILENYFEVIGLDKVLKTETFISKGSAMQMGLEFPMTIYQKRPGKVRMEAEIQGTKMVQVYDGEIGWSVIPWTGSMEPQVAGEDEIKSLKQMADMEGDLYNWKEKGFDLSLIGEDDMEGTAVFKLKLLKPEGDEYIYFMDAENFVVLRMDAKIMMQGTQIEASSSFSNFKPVSGTIIPHSVEQKMNGQVMMNLTIESVVMGSKIPDSMFEKPSDI